MPKYDGWVKEDSRVEDWVMTHLSLFGGTNTINSGNDRIDGGNAQGNIDTSVIDGGGA